MRLDVADLSPPDTPSLIQLYCLFQILETTVFKRCAVRDTVPGRVQEHVCDVEQRKHTAGRDPKDVGTCGK